MSPILCRLSLNKATPHKVIQPCWCLTNSSHSSLLCVCFLKRDFVLWPPPHTHSPILYLNYTVCELGQSLQKYRNLYFIDTFCTQALKNSWFYYHFSFYKNLNKVSWSYMTQNLFEVCSWDLQHKQYFLFTIFINMWCSIKQWIEPFSHMAIIHACVVLYFDLLKHISIEHIFFC